MNCSATRTGVLWIMDATDEDCGKNEAADVLAATRTLRWLGQRHNEYVERVGEDEGRGDLRYEFSGGE